MHKILCLLALLLSACGAQAPEATSTNDDEAVENRGSDTTNWWDKLPRSAWSAFERVHEDVGWYEVYRLRPAIYALYEPGQFEEVISFLIVGDDRALLFDTGLGIAPIKPVVDRLTDKPIIVVNSHSHYDHIGGNHEFADIRSLDNVFSKERARGLGNDDVGEFVRGDWVWKAFPEGFDPDEYVTQPWQVSERIEDGAVIDLGGRQLEVLFTPGHALDALCLLDRENRLLLTGDTFYLAPLYAHLSGSAFATYHKSVDRLAALEGDVDFLLTAHNVPMVPGSYLAKLKAAFDTVAADAKPHVETDGAWQYDFGDFSIIAPPLSER